MTDDGSIAEKRVFAGRAGRTDVYVAADLGLIRARVSGAIVGEFAAIARAPGNDVTLLPPDVAARIAGIDADHVGNPAGNAPGDGAASESPDGPGRIGVAFAADDGLRVGLATPNRVDLRETEFGSTVAVGRHAGALVAAGPDGVVARLPGDGIDRLGDVREPRAVDGPLVAAADGVHRLTETGAGTGPRWTLSPVGLDDVWDVAGQGVPLAASADGLYWLANGWMRALDGAFIAVAADGAGGALAAGDGLHRRTARDGWGSRAWEPAALPSGGRPATIGYGPGIAVVATDDGTLFVDAGDGWRDRALGARGVGGLAVAGGQPDAGKGDGRDERSEGDDTD